jgi:hypothetical protein
LSKQDKRTNLLTGEVEHWIQPKGLPGIWKPIGFCKRCQTFKECIGLVALSDEEWEELENIIEATRDLVNVKNRLVANNLKKCSV